MAKRELRFGVGDGEGRRATTWKLWTTGKSEVYMASRSLGAMLKVSLHESGAWHIAYSADAFLEYVKDALPQQDRFIEKWSRPAEVSPGATLAFRIVTPWSAVVTQVETSTVKDLIWLPPASEPQATEIDIIITAPGTRVSGWPAKRSMGTSLIGSLLLENDQTVWAVYRIIEMPSVEMPNVPNAMKGTGGFYKGKTKNDLDGEGLRALVIGDEPDGSRVLIDCVVVRSAAVTDALGGSGED